MLSAAGLFQAPGGVEVCAVVGEAAFSSWVRLCQKKVGGHKLFLVPGFSCIRIKLIWRTVVEVEQPFNTRVNPSRMPAGQTQQEATLRVKIETTDSKRNVKLRI